MKITIESTPELAHANGLPVRVWTGTTERGTPVLALVTRVAVPPGADASELAGELSEPPTRVVDPSGVAIASPRACTVCLARDVRRPATHVARDAAGLEWFECGSHEPTDNVADTRRLALEPIADWFDRHEIPLPAGVYRGPASEREPWASIIAGLDADSRRAPMDLREASMLAGLDLVASDRIAELTTECRTLRERLRSTIHHGLKETGKPWLVKDFWALFRAAAATLDVDTIEQAKDTREALRHQVARLRPAFDVCESERRGVPDRLTSGERFALDGLHRWLHSPGGDCELTDAAQPYHDQVESESPGDCERLEAEETLAYADVRMARREPRLPHDVITAIVDNEHAGSSVFVLNAMRGAQSGWHAKHAHPDQVALTGRRDAPHDEPARSAWLMGFRLGAGLNPAADLAEGETPTAPAVGGVCRVCKCTDDDCSQCIAKTGSPCAWVEPDLCSACVGDLPQASPATVKLTGKAPEVSVVVINPNDPAPLWEQAERPAQRVPSSMIPPYVLDRIGEYSPEVFELTDALREQARELSYRAPETLTARDRALIAACEADEAARAKSPETWVGGKR